MNPTPKTHSGDFANPPAALKPLFLERRWVNWKWVEGKNGKWTKPPFQPAYPESHASNDKFETWDASSAAIKTVLAGHAKGIGFALTGSSYCAIDMDHCRDPESGKSMLGLKPSSIAQRMHMSKSPSAAPDCALLASGSGRPHTANLAFPTHSTVPASKSTVRLRAISRSAACRSARAPS